MKGRRVNRRSLLLGMALAPAVVRAARASPMTLRLSSSLPNNPQFANGRVYYDNLVKRLAADGLADRIDVQFFPDNQLGQEIDVVNSVSLGVIDLMVTGTSIWANVVPLIGFLDLGYLFESFPQQTKALDGGAAKPLEQALKSGANVHIIGWAYNFGSRSVLCKSPVNAPARPRRQADPHPAQQDHHRMPAADGRGGDAAGVRRDLHRPPGRRARWAGA